MRRRRSGSRYSLREWIARSVLAALVAVVAYIGAVQALARALRTKAPERAYQLWSWDGRITAAQAMALAGPNATPADRKRADAFARQALRQDPTAVAAVTTLGVDTQLRGDIAHARRLFAYAQKLSRRDLLTQLWAIEDAVGRGDVATALRHYDIALRTSTTARDVLFPVLASASREGTVRGALVSTLVGKPAWRDSFIEYAANRGSDLPATPTLFLALRRAGVPISELANALLLQRLVANGDFPDAWSYYAAVRAGSERNMSRDPKFGSMLADPSPFDWVPTAGNGMTGAIRRGDRDGFFEFSAPATLGGKVLQQWQMLPSGEYELEGRSSGVEQSADAAPYWVLQCRDGPELGRIILSASPSAGNFSGRFNVPANCPVQLLSLVVRPSDAIGGVSGQIDRTQLRPVR